MTEDAPNYDVTPEPAPAVAAPPTEASPAERAFIAALAMAQGTFDTITKNRMAQIRPRDADKTPYSFAYADLGEILRAVRPALAANGLASSSKITPGKDGHIWLQAILMHAEGWREISELPLQLEVKDIKELGIRIAYLRRYLRVAQLDLAAEDDIDEDGEEAQPRGYSTQRQAPAPAPRAKPQRARAAPAAAPVSEPPPPDDGPPLDDDAAPPPAASGEPIAAGQVAYLQKKLGAYFTNGEAKKWLADHNVGHLEELPASRFDEIKAAVAKL